MPLLCQINVEIPTGKPVAPFHVSSRAQCPSGEFYIHSWVNTWYSVLRVSKSMFVLYH